MFKLLQESVRIDVGKNFLRVNQVRHRKKRPHKT